jgi:hypothetical protein
MNPRLISPIPELARMIHQPADGDNQNPAGIETDSVLVFCSAAGSV